MCENFVKHVYKNGIRRKASKDLLVEMFMRVTYATNAKDYSTTLEEL